MQYSVPPHVQPPAPTSPGARLDMFEQRLRQLEQQHLLRRLRTIESASEAEVTLNGRPIILMASNNYLGLATHPALKRAAIQATERFGVGAGEL